VQTRSLLPHDDGSDILLRCGLYQRIYWIGEKYFDAFCLEHFGDELRNFH